MNLKMSTRILITIVTAAFALPLIAAPPSDVEATKLLVGTWLIPRSQYDSAAKDGSVTFKTDGTFSSYAVFWIQAEEIRIDVQGKWKVKDGMLIEEVTSSSRPQMPAVGSTSRDTLLALTDKEYRYRTERGTEHTYTRK
jgi:hypothetical protein